MQSPLEPVSGARAISVADLFIGFLGLGLISFGGALPFARRALVEERRWLSADEFTDLLGLCQFLPGGNVINLSVAVGMRFRGVPGALAGLMGLVAGPTLVVVALGVLYAKTQQHPQVQHLFGGLAAAAAGLLIAMAGKVAKPLRHARQAACIAALAVVAIAGLRIALLPTMLVLTPVSIWLASRAQRGTRGSEGGAAANAANATNGTNTTNTTNATNATNATNPRSAANVDPNPPGAHQ